jgi:O-Antigen ligase
MESSNPRVIVPIAASIIGGLLIAVIVGATIGQGNIMMVTFVLAGALTLAVAIMLRTSIWLLLPITLPVGGSLTFLPIPFSPFDVCVGLAVGSFLIFYALHLVQVKAAYGYLDVVLFLNLAYIASVFIRHPAGFQAIGSEMVGGRVYFNIAVAFAAYWVLSRARANERQGFWLPALVLGAVGGAAMLNALAVFVPATVPFIYAFYSGVDVSSYLAQDDPDPSLTETVGRQFWLLGFATQAFPVLCAYFNPLTLLLPVYPLRFFLFLLGSGAVMFAGYRGVLIATVFIVLLSTYFHNGMRALVKIVVIGILALTVLIAGQGSLFNLPLPAQRALSFLPGKWDPIAVRNAASTTEWRVEMWKLVLQGQYLKNPWLGDGFGFSAYELQVMARNRMNRMGDASQAQEDALVVGALHGGPVSAIRYAGIVGLFLFYALMVASAAFAWRSINSARGSRYFPLALFIGVPVIYLPVFYTLVFGGYDDALPKAIIAVGMLKMLSGSLRRTPYKAPRVTPQVAPASSLALAR